MRVAPIGLVAGAEDAFELGSQVAALTHGHPSGSLSAGFLAYLIRRIITGDSLQDAMIAAKEILTAHQNHEEVLSALEAAEQWAASRDLNALRDGRLGEGWVAEESLAISVYCALVSHNFEEAVMTAVNHSGDSDSTGAITGNICGALYGIESVPDRWVGQLELGSEIAEIADDLAALSLGVFDASSEITWQRYPGY